MLRPAAKAALAFVVGCAGGSAFYLLGLPLPWTLGSLLATAILVVCGVNWLMPAAARDLVRPLIGVLAGSAFTPIVVQSLVYSWEAVAFVASYSIVITALGFAFFRLVCKLDRVTAFFAAAPGGLSELILLGSQLGGNVRTLVMIQTIRVVAVVFTVPISIQLMTDADLSGGAAFTVATHAGMGAADWLMIALCCAAGFLAGKYLPLPGGTTIAALVLSGVLHATGLTRAVPPVWLVAMVQIVIGASAGARFAGIRWEEVRNTVLYAVIWAAIMLGAATLMALIGSQLFARTFSAFLLALAPGGLPEMTIVTYALGIDVAFVVTCHVCRILLVLTLAPLLARWVMGRGGPDPI